MSNNERTANRTDQAARIVEAWAACPGRAVIFDFNGTLSDDEGIIESIYIDIFAKHLGWQLSPTEYRDKLIGLSDREIVERAVGNHAAGDAELAEALLGLRRDMYKVIVADRSPISAESTELVKRLDDAGIPMAIVTGAQRDDVMAVLNHCEAGSLITQLVTEEDVRSGKPDPEGFLRGAGLINAAPADVLVFEDSVPGVMGAIRAGMRCIAVAGTTPSSKLLSIAPAVTDRIHPSLLDGIGI
ncbi:MAG: HAD family hydrolase [Geodermatophilaceae bacterium]